MKKLFLLVFIVSVVGVATAEVIDSVSFNPSRLGRYQHLKVADKLDVGCLTTQSMMLDVGCRVTMNYSGSSAVDIGCAYVSGVDMDDETTMYVPSVYLIGGTTETNGDVKLNGNLQAPEATSVYVNMLNLPKHTVRVNGGGKLWEGENYSDKSFVLGGNNISSPTECEELGWFVRKDEKTNADFKVLGCNPKQKEAKCKVLSDFGTASSSGIDTCDGNKYGWYSGICTEEMLAKGSCTDYYNIGCSTANMTGKWCYQNSAGNYECQSSSDWRLPSYRKSGYTQGGCGCSSYNCTTTNEEYNCADDYKCKLILNRARGQGSYNPTSICKELFPITDQLISSPSSITGLSRWTSKGDNWYYYEREGAFCSGPNDSGNRCMCCGGNPVKYDCSPFKLRCELEVIKDTTSLYKKYTFKTVYE